MDGRRRWTVAAVVVVALALLLVSLGGFRWTRVVGVLGGLASGLFLAVSAVALITYRDRRDPAMLLVGVGAAAVVVHELAVAVAMAIAPGDDAIVRVIGYSSVASLIVLAASLLPVVPWRDRRGRPPLSAQRVVGAAAAGLLGLDLLAAVSPSEIAQVQGELPALGWLLLTLLVVLGVVVAVHSWPRGERFRWVAAAGASLSLMGVASILSTRTHAQRALIALISWTTVTPALGAACLGVFVLAGLRLESSRMRRASDRASEVMEGRAEIASSIAHDVRSPVSTIKGLATTTRASYERLSDEERLEFVGMIEQESSRLLALVNQTALALKVDAETLDYDLHPRPLPPMLAEAIEQVEAGAHPVSTDVQEMIVAPADSRWFVEAVRQGVENAVKFSPPEAPIVVRLRADGEDAVVEIQDAGPGVPPEQREEVFRRFTTWRPDGYEGRPGSALGLFITRGIARGHGGDASLDDAPGGGTILRIRLPREAGPA